MLQSPLPSWLCNSAEFPLSSALWSRCNVSAPRWLHPHALIIAGGDGGCIVRDAQTFLLWTWEFAQLKCDKFLNCANCWMICVIGNLRSRLYPLFKQFCVIKANSVAESTTLLILPPGALHSCGFYKQPPAYRQFCRVICVVLRTGTLILSCILWCTLIIYQKWPNLYLVIDRKCRIIGVYNIFLADSRH
jgi:hypothetical protein